MRGDALMALFDGLTGRVERRAKSMVEQARQRAEVAYAEFPDLMLSRDGDEIVISGRGLLRRWVSDVRLRFALWRNR
jgi:hypothetical protein